MIATSIARSLPPAVADRLIKIIGLFGSAHDGEVVAAARQATRLLRQHNCTWAELLEPIVLPPPPARPRHRPAAQHAPVNWRANAAACLARADLLTDWEHRFVANLFGFRRLSPKQEAVLGKLVKRVRAAAGGAP